MSLNNDAGKILLKARILRELKEIKERWGLIPTIDLLTLRHPCTFSEKCFCSKGGGGRHRSEALAIFFFCILMNLFSRAASFNSLQTMSQGLFLFMRSFGATGNSFRLLFITQNCYASFHLRVVVFIFSLCFSCCMQLPLGYLSVWFLPVFRCKSVVCNRFFWLGTSL